MELHKLDFPIGSSEPSRVPLGPTRLERVNRSSGQ